MGTRADAAGEDEVRVRRRDQQQRGVVTPSIDRAMLGASRICPLESMAGYQPSARWRVSTASHTRASTGNPKENPTPGSWQAWANLWV